MINQLTMCFSFTNILGYILTDLYVWIYISNYHQIQNHEWKLHSICVKEIRLRGTDMIKKEKQTLQWLKMYIIIS